MKFVSLGRRKRTDRRGNFDQLSQATVESFTKSTAAPRSVHTYKELQQQIHDDLRQQHPDWVQPDGNSPMCDSYEARLMELIDPLASHAT